MNYFLCIAFTLIFSYLLGSLNSAILVCKLWKHTDIRDYGSNNAGLTNVLRVYGKGPALVTLFCDLAKGVIAVVTCRFLITTVIGLVFFNNGLFIGYVAGIAVMLGHIYPVYYGFHGGKGVLIAATTLVAIDPLTCLLSVGVFIAVVAITKYVSVGSIVAAYAYPLFTILTQTLRHFEGVWQNALIAFLIAVLITYMHRTNIQRLKAGTENKFGAKKKSE